VLLTGGHGQVRHAGMGRTGMSWAGCGRSGDNLVCVSRLEGARGQEGPWKPWRGPDKEVGSSVGIPGQEWREEQSTQRRSRVQFRASPSICFLQS